MHDRRVASVARRWWAGDLGAAGALLDIVLAPAEALYRAGVAARNRAFAASIVRTHRVMIPVVSIGNVAVGGTGKTPFAHHIAHVLQARGAHPAILHGGYAADEPALHRHWSPDIPVIVDRDRVRGAEHARSSGADVVVLDDGFQHRRLHRDLDIVLVSVERWNSAPRLLPRGPWREPLHALHRADMIVATRKTATATDGTAVLRALSATTAAPVLLAHIEPVGWRRAGAAAEPPPASALAVAALADPDLFVDSARLAGAEVHTMLGFPDHHAYSEADAQLIVRQAGGAPIVTTQKDWIKLHTLLPPDTVWVLEQRVQIEHGADTLDTRLDELIRLAREVETRQS